MTSRTDPQYNVFHSWYAPGGPGSGPGSTPEYTVAWRHFLEGFVRGSGARSVLDFGCGDWQFSRMIDWGDATYHGVDIVPSLIARLSKEYGRPGVSFSVVDPENPILPAADLLITKDVLQHLPNAGVSRLLEKFSCAKTWILINDRPPDFVQVNQDSPVAGYREIDFTKPPFSLKGREIFQFGPPWRKVAFLVRR